MRSKIRQSDDLGHRSFSLDSDVGYIRGSETPRGELLIGTMQVSAESRGKGHGSAMYAEYEKHVRGKGIRRVVTNPANDRAANFWENQGFRQKRKGEFHVKLI